MCNNIFDPRYTYINISSPQSTVEIGSTVQLETEIVNKYYYPSDDDPNKVLLQEILQGTIQWTSLTPAIATVRQNGLVNCVLQIAITISAIHIDIPQIAGTINLNFNICDNLSSIDVTEWTTQEDRAMQRIEILESNLDLCVASENFTDNVQEALAIILRDWYLGTPGGWGIKQIIEQSLIDPETFLDDAIAQLNTWYTQLNNNDLIQFEPFGYQIEPISCTSSSNSLCNNLDEIAVCASGQIYEALKIAVTNANNACEYGDK